MPLNNEILVKNIKKLCKDNNVSISTLERDLFISPGLISRWARTKTTPALDSILDIANYFQISIDALIGTANEAVNSDKTINRLLITLYNKTKDAEIEWQIFNPYHAENHANTAKIAAMLNDAGTDCFYCNVNRGSFILTIEHSDKKENLSLYVLADENSFPELKCTNAEKLYNLYSYLLKRLSSSLNTMKTNNFINDFLNQNADNASSVDTFTIFKTG